MNRSVSVSQFPPGINSNGTITTLITDAELSAKLAEVGE